MIVTVSLNSTLDRVYTVPNMQVGQQHRVANARDIAGGKALNVARVAHILGSDVRVVGFIAGYTGAKIQALAERDGLLTHFVTVAGESRQAHTFLHDHHPSTEIIEAGPHVTEHDLQALQEQLQQVITPGSFVSLSGSLPPGAPAETYAEWIHMIRSLHAYPVLDASGEALHYGAEAIPYAIKPNKPELEQYVGRHVTPDMIPDIAMAFHEAGIAWVLISLGADGMVAATGGHVWRVSVPQVDVVTAVGSGDAFIGGWLAALSTLGVDKALSDDDIVAVLRQGNAAAVSNAMQEKIGVCDVEQMKRIMEEVKIEKIDRR